MFQVFGYFVWRNECKCARKKKEDSDDKVPQIHIDAASVRPSIVVKLLGVRYALAAHVEQTYSDMLPPKVSEFRTPWAGS